MKQQFEREYLMRVIFGMIDFLVKILPAIVGLLYLIVGICYIAKRDFAWAMVWISYALANIGLILVGMKE